MKSSQLYSRQERCQRTDSAKWGREQKGKVETGIRVGSGEWARLAKRLQSVEFKGEEEKSRVESKWMSKGKETVQDGNTALT